MSYFSKSTYSSSSSSLSKNKRNHDGNAVFKNPTEILSQDLITSQDFLQNGFSQRQTPTQSQDFALKLSNFPEPSQFFQSSAVIFEDSSQLFPISSSCELTQSQMQDEFDFLTENSQAFFSDDNENESDSSNEMEMESISSSPPNIISTQAANSSMNNSLLTINNHIDTDNYNSRLPDTILNLHNDIKREFSDWTWISIIAGQVGCEIFPMGVYGNLKIALLLSLVSSTPLHLIGIGQETSHASIIMNLLGRFASRFFNVCLNYDGVSVKKNTERIEAGPLLLATNGVTFIGNWQKLSQKTIMKYLREIETGNIMVDKIQQHFPLETTIWAYWSCTTKIKKDIQTTEQFLK